MNSESKKALFIIDVEEKFITNKTKNVLESIVNWINNHSYDLYIVAEYSDKPAHSESCDKSTWQEKHGVLQHDEQIAPSIKRLLRDKHVEYVVKSTRSVFGNDSQLYEMLKKHSITEVHLCGLETHDCILATALDAFDHDLRTYVIPSCCASKSFEDHDAALQILKRLNLVFNETPDS